jgi:hypothetical protein
MGAGRAPKLPILSFFEGNQGNLGNQDKNRLYLKDLAGSPPDLRLNPAWGTWGTNSTQEASGKAEAVEGRAVRDSQGGENGKNPR